MENNMYINMYIYIEISICKSSDVFLINMKIKIANIS